MNVKTAAFGGSLSPKQVLLDALNEAEKLETIIICAKYKNGNIEYAWSKHDPTSLIGLASLAALRIDEALREDA